MPVSKMVLKIEKEKVGASRRGVGSPWRQYFPIFKQARSKPLIYLDSAATAQKPRAVITAVANFYRQDNANINRGVYDLSLKASARYEQARGAVAKHLNAAQSEEIIFTRNATEAINLVAVSLGRSYFRRGDRIVLTKMEHHSNIVPWQIVAQEKGLELIFVDVTDEGQLNLEQLQSLLVAPTRLLALAHVSNVLGTINPVTEIVHWARGAGIPVLVDGCQAVPHLPVDVQALGCDFYVFSGHKLGGPTGIGVLYGREQWLERMAPFLGGGDMIDEVTTQGFTPAELPNKFEAGTPHLAGAVGLQTALEFLQEVGFDRLQTHDRQLLSQALKALRQLPFVHILGPQDLARRAAVVSFVVDGVHAHDVAEVLNQEGICVRAGHHCAQPLMVAIGIPACVRASFWLYNTKAEIEALIDGLKKAQIMFAH